jgi:hypothetical protein
VRTWRGAEHCTLTFQAEDVADGTPMAVLAGCLVTYEAAYSAHFGRWLALDVRLSRDA